MKRKKKWKIYIRWVARFPLLVLYKQLRIVWHAISGLRTRMDLLSRATITLMLDRLEYDFAMIWKKYISLFLIVDFASLSLSLIFNCCVVVLLLEFILSLLDFNVFFVIFVGISETLLSGILLIVSLFNRLFAN